MTTEKSPPPADSDPPLPNDPTIPPVVVDAARLFGPSKEIQLEFMGTRYRLRVTRRGKLILQK